MEIVNIPIVDFYKNCLDCAYERGFKWVLCLLAREADAKKSYDQIKRYWNSLHDLTGTEILFVFAGALKEEDEFSSILHHENETWRGLRNATLHIVDEETPTIPYYKYPKIDFNKHSFGMIKANHTRSISELRDYLGLSEKMIPSLIFTPTYQLIQDKHVVVPLKGENIYQEIKNIIGNLESPLKELKVEQYNYQQIKSQLEEISHQIETFNHGTKAQRRYANAKSCLNIIIDNTDDSELKNNLMTAMRSQSVTDWNAFDHKTRAYLNQYIDLLKNNPNIESECKKMVSELERLRLESNKKNSIAENIHNKIISQYENLGQIIQGLSNKVDSDEGKSNMGEKRFKIAFSFPGEYREIVHKIARGVADIFTEECILYDWFHRAEFARPNLDIHLQNLYKNESELIVVFICADYNRKKWCGIEWRAIRELLNGKRADDRILFVKCGDGEVDGVFSTVDGYIDSTQVSIEDIINDIMTRYSAIAKTRNINNESETKDELIQRDYRDKEKVEFLFELELSGKAEKIPVYTKNNIRKWYFNGQRGEVNVKIHDKRQTKIIENRSYIDKKINMQEELSTEEEYQYEIYTRAIKKCEHECKLKEQAIKFFLEDRMLQAYIHITTYLELVDYVEKILDYEYFDQKKFTNPDYIALDIFLDPAPKICHDHFVACVEKDKVKEIFSGRSLYDFWGTYVIDLGSQVIKEIAINFYLFLAEEVIDFNNIELSDNKKVINLLEYKVGRH